MKLQIKNKLVQCEVKNSSEGLKQGMMGRGRLDGCMVFILPYRGEQSFWMKNCLVPLDIVFCNDNKVTAVHKNCEPCEEEPCKNYTGTGNIALEFKAGFCQEIDLKAGDEIKFVN
jgi:uncharacterized membrane protein (UPF0127 family)